MKFICSGGFGKPDSHIVYINSVLGYLLQILYIMFSAVSWYEVIQYACILLSLATITYVISNTSNDDLFKRTLFMVFLFFAAYTLYAQLQYTKTAAILTVAGYLLLKYQLDNKIKSYIYPVVLLFFGMIYRRDSFFACSLICVGIFIPYLVEYFKNKNNDDNKKRIINLVKIGVVSLALLLVTIGADKINYSSEEWKYYLEYNKVRTNLLDGGFPLYEDNVDNFDKYDISYTDLQMYMNWDIDDNEKFSLETMKEIDSMKNADPINVDYLKNFVYYSIRYFFFNSKVIYLSLMLLSLIVLSILFYKEDLYTYLYMGLSWLLCVFYCFYIRKDNTYIAHVQISFLLAMNCLLIYKIRPQINNITKRLYIISCIFVFMVFVSLHIDSWRITEFSIGQTSDYRSNVLRKINEDNEHLYFRREANNMYFVDDLFVADIKYSGSNLLGFGGWYTAAPIRNEMKAKYNVVNPFKDIVNNGLVYFVSDNYKDDVNYVLEYIQNNYYENAKVIKIHDLDSNYTIYKFVTD